MASPDFSKLFEDGKVIKTAQWEVTLRARPLCELVVPTGEIVACDPFTSPDAEAFSRAVPAGSYPVVLSVAHFDDGDQRVAAAMLKFSERAPASWEMALVAGDDPSQLEEGEIFGYAVESGSGCFMDEAAARALMARMERDEDYFESMLDAMDGNYVDTWAWAGIRPDEELPANVVAFSAGVGEESYASYFGLDEDGNVACLVTDFSLFEHEEMT
jgi:hypothetical protein